MAKISDYELLQVLGSGTYATVHKAVDKRTRQPCAIKVMDRKRFTKDSNIENLIREIEILKNLNHRYIVQLYDFGADAKYVYIIMELCDTSLSTFIKARKKLPESTCRYFIRSLAEAIKYMRENNISHFDLKPQNLLLKRPKPNSNYILKVADFGFAQKIESEEENCSVKGSPLYMGPEIIMHKKYDCRADLWSTGVILYECIFGKAPYSSSSLEELLDKIKSKQKIEIPSNVKISPECEDLLTRLLQHDPDKRITFQEFFNHEFVDLKHAPSDENMERAIEILRRAVEEDKNQNYREAYHLYCEALTFFVPLIDAESSESKKAALQERAALYLNRAEEIKHSILLPSRKVTEKVPDVPSTSQRQNVIEKILEPSQLYTTLYDKCSSQQLRNGLEIGQQAEYYMYEKKLEIALENYKRALGILVPLLSNETDTERKGLLHKQILNWMKEAESIKSILSAQQNIQNAANAANTNSHCTIS